MAPLKDKHIALIYAGGTIGMARTAQGYAPMPEFDRVLPELLGQAPDLPRFSLHAYAQPIDSSNATPADWQRVAHDIADRYSDFDGFVVLHGTDTMAYTASALSFMLQGLRKPVILTGSQIPLGEPGSDALPNLLGALRYAASETLQEVAIYFGRRLLRGNRAVKTSSTALQAFDTPNYPYLAQERLSLTQDDTGRALLNTALLLPRATQERFELPSYDSGRIHALRFTPGMPLSLVKAVLDLPTQALVLECYGAGNAPDREPALLEILANGAARGIVIAACSQCAHGGVAPGTYATGSALVRAGVVGAGDMTFEALFAKLHHLFALGLSPEEVCAGLTRDLSGELSA